MKTGKAVSKPVHTCEQELLLRAALCQGEEALSAWRAWSNLVNLASIDGGSARLLPLLYHNLQLNCVADPPIGKLLEEYVQTWCHNEILFHELGNLLRSFQTNGIETLLLKGAPLALLFYKDLGLRPMSDVDVLVRRQQARSAIKILHRAGWKSIYESPEALIPYQHAVEFTHDEGHRLDLHWRVLWDGKQEISDDEYWDSAVTMEIDDVRTRTLNPADHLLHICVHGAAWNNLPPLRWVADAAYVLRVAGPAINWDQLVKRTRERRLMLPMRDALAYLQDLLGIPIPSDVVKIISNIPASRLESTLYRLRAGEQPFLRKLNTLYYWYCAWRLAHNSYHQRFLDFLRYLRCFGGAKVSLALRGRKTQLTQQVLPGLAALKD